jgi:hypothetical protein
LAFSFLRCMIEDNEELKEVWTKYDDGIDLKVYTPLKLLTVLKQDIFLELRVSCHVFKYEMPGFC